MSNLDTALAMVAAYNAQNADAYVALMSEDACEALYRAEVLRHAREGTREGLKTLFAEYPDNRAEVLKAYEMGNYVILHEKVSRSHELDSFEVMSVYSFEGELCSRVEFIR